MRPTDREIDEAVRNVPEPEPVMSLRSALAAMFIIAMLGVLAVASVPIETIPSELHPEEFQQ